MRKFVILQNMNTTFNTSDSPRRTSFMSILLKVVVPLVVSVGLCWVMFSSIDFGEMMAVIRRDCDFRWIGLMLLLSLVPLVLRALRWGIQLRAVGMNPPLHVLLYSIVGCYSLNLVFPRFGEVWRTGYVAFRGGKSFSTVFGSMIADRFADLLTVLLMLGGTLIVARGPIVDFVRTYPDAYRRLLALATSPWLWATGILLLGAAWWLLARSRNPLIGRVRGFLAGLWEGFAAIARMEHKWAWLGLTFAIWGCYFLQMVMAFNAFPVIRDLLHHSGLVVVLVCFVLTAISMGIPSNGGIGPYQTTLLFGLLLFLPATQASNAAAGLAPISTEAFRLTAIAFGNVIIASQTLLLIILGLLVFLGIALDKHSR